MLIIDRYLLRVVSCLVRETLFPEGVSHFGDHLRDLDGVRSQLSGLQLVIGNVGASSNALHIRIIIKKKVYINIINCDIVVYV